MIITLQYMKPSNFLKGMRSGSFKNVINKMGLKFIYLIYMQKQDLPLNNRQWLKGRKPNHYRQSKIGRFLKPCNTSKSITCFCFFMFKPLYKLQNQILNVVLEKEIFYSLKFCMAYKITIKIIFRVEFNLKSENV